MQKFMQQENAPTPFVSILTPVYNGEKYLRECIESVLAQTYENWEYVIVNNCSTDRTIEIAREYACKDKRIRIHDNSDFLPVMENLNHAFRQISGNSKYCKVIHADDWLFPTCVEQMVQLSEQNPSVGLVSSYRMIENRVGPDGLSYPSNCIPGDKIARTYLLKEKFYFGAPSTVMIRSDLIRKREKVYDESFLQADISACLDFLLESDFGFIHQVLSFTRRHDKSTTETKAKKYAKYMFGYLKIHLEYGPKYLNDQEMKESLARRINIFYIQFARNLLAEKSLNTYRRHKEDLESVGLSLKQGKLFKQVVMEMIKMLLKRILSSNGIA